eukprot:gnl/Hemi2/21288_TR7060_c0_g1_i1.p1 gnl/Hemi2/21288_TR7060_c0_g1~~gnl/Hemi2/21288_TR7060_c0_g1_i1.p1  ORF type:complete len:447 (-),score=138.89 gnl/Hemi2/21288_TR7060_c0_g1_i1:75-1415(-)
MVHPDEWADWVQVELMQKNGFIALDASASPLVWTTNNRLIGSLRDWEDWVLSHFGVSEQVAKETLAAVAEENMKEAEITYFLKLRAKRLLDNESKLADLAKVQLLATNRDNALKLCMVSLRALVLVTERYEGISLNTGFKDQFLLSTVKVETLRKPSDSAAAVFQSPRSPRRAIEDTVSAIMGHDDDEDAGGTTPSSHYDEDRLPSTTPTRDHDGEVLHSQLHKPSIIAPEGDETMAEALARHDRRKGVHFAPDTVGGEDEDFAAHADLDGLDEDARQIEIQIRRENAEKVKRQQEQQRRLRELHATFKKKFKDIFQLIPALDKDLDGPDEPNWGQSFNDARAALGAVVEDLVSPWNMAAVTKLFEDLCQPANTIREAVTAAIAATRKQIAIVSKKLDQVIHFAEDDVAQWILDAGRERTHPSGKDDHLSVISSDDDEDCSDDDDH